MVAFCPISSTAPLISDGFAKAAEWRTAPALESGVMGYAYLAITLLLTVAGLSADQFRSRFAYVVEHEPPPLVLTPSP